MDSFTQNMVEKARKRREKLDKKMAEVEPVKKRGHPLTERNNTPQDDDEQDSPKRYRAEKDYKSSSNSRRHYGDSRRKSPSPLKSASSRVSPGQKRSLDPVSPAPSARRTRLAALAQDINNWEDDLSHPVIRKTEEKKKTWKAPSPIETGSPTTPRPFNSRNSPAKNSPRKSPSGEMPTKPTRTYEYSRESPHSSPATRSPARPSPAHRRSPAKASPEKRASPLCASPHSPAARASPAAAARHSPARPTASPRASPAASPARSPGRPLVEDAARPVSAIRAAWTERLARREEDEPTKKPVSDRRANWEQKVQENNTPRMTKSTSRNLRAPATAPAHGAPVSRLAKEDTDPLEMSMCSRRNIWEDKIAKAEVEKRKWSPAKRANAARPISAYNVSGERNSPAKISPRKSPGRVEPATRSIHERLEQLQDGWKTNEIAEKIKKQKETDMEKLSNRWKNEEASEAIPEPPPLPKTPQMARRGQDDLSKSAPPKGLTGRGAKKEDNRHRIRNDFESKLKAMGFDVNSDSDSGAHVASVDLTPYRHAAKKSPVKKVDPKQHQVEIRPPQNEIKTPRGTSIYSLIKKGGASASKATPSAANLRPKATPYSGRKHERKDSFDSEFTAEEDDEELETVKRIRVVQRIAAPQGGDTDDTQTDDTQDEETEYSDEYEDEEEYTEDDDEEEAPETQSEPDLESTDDIISSSSSETSVTSASIVDDVTSATAASSAETAAASGGGATTSEANPDDTPEEAMELGAAEEADALHAEEIEGEPDDEELEEDADHTGELDEDDYDESEDNAAQIDSLLEEAMDSTDVEGEPPRPVPRAALRPGRTPSLTREPVSKRPAVDLRTPRSRMVQFVGVPDSPATPTCYATDTDTQSEADSERAYSLDEYRIKQQQIKTTPRQQQATPKQVIVREEERRPRKELPVSPEKSVKQKMEELQSLINREQNVIMQTSNALNQCCNSDSAFNNSLEQVECHRLLLLACKRRETFIEEQRRLRDGRVDPGADLPRGSVTLSDIRLPIKRDILNRIAQGTDTHIYYFLGMIRHRSSVIVTQMMSSFDIHNGVVEFPNLIKISNITKLFRFELEIYGMAIQKQAEVEKTPKKNKTPKKKGGFLGLKARGGGTPGMASPGGPNAVRSSLFSLVGTLPLTMRALHNSNFAMEKVGLEARGGGTPGMASPGGPNAVRSSLFSLVGTLPLTMRALHNSNFAMEKVPYTSCLQGSVQLNLRCLMETSIEEKGFLKSQMAMHAAQTCTTMFEDVSGFGAWHRRWCALRNNALSFWRYPDDEHHKEPIEYINLKECITDVVALIPRDICARPNSFELLTVRPQNRGEKDTLTTKCYNTITTKKHWLSADTKDERIFWCDRLNEALNNVRTWNPDALRPLKAARETDKESNI